ncbi:MAG: four helix bundle protein [Candidatus Moraniibacteriota bacterium]
MMENIKAQSYRDLIVWQKGMDLVVSVYILTKKFPREEIYALTSQMRRAAVSIPSNIAEGKCRKSKKEYIQFLRIAYASGAELETQIEIAKRLKYGEGVDFSGSDDFLLQVMKMLHAILIKLDS